MATFAMARSAIAVFRFIKVSPLHEASMFNRLHLVKRGLWTRRATIAGFIFRGCREASAEITVFAGWV
jgi:hypothetical protein